MSQRSEIYREFRERIKTLGELAGQQSNKDLLIEVDKFWRVLLKVRAAITKTLIHQGKIKDSKEVSAEDFSSLYLQIHNPKRDSRLCEHCCGLVEFGIVTCPYCGEHVNGQNTNEFIQSITIDIQAKPKGPNWNIDYSAKEMLEKAKLKESFDKTPVLVPRATRYEELGGPRGTSGQERNTTKKKKLSRTAEEILRWARRRELCSKMPLSISQLQSLRRFDLVLIAQMFQKQSPMSDKEIFVLPTTELIRFIQGYQPDKPFDVGNPPVGEIPDLEDDNVT